jgi:hypothetical protein
MPPDEGVKINISIDDHPSIAPAVHSVEDVSTMLHGEFFHSFPVLNFT